MKMIYYISFAFWTTLLLLPKQFSANEADDLKRMSRELAKANTLTVQVKVNLFKKVSDLHPLSSFDGDLRKDGKLFYSSMMGHTYLNNTSCSVDIDEQDRTILLAKSVNDSKSSQNNDINSQFAMFDTLLKKNYILKYVSSTENEKVISISVKNDPIYSKILVSIDPKTGLLDKVTYEYNTKNTGLLDYEKVEISYLNFKLNTPIDKSLFSEQKFVSKQGNTFIPASAYKSYKLINKLKS